MPVATAAQTGSGCVGPDRRQVHRRAAIEQAAEIRQPPAATRGQTYSSDAPSSSSIVTCGTAALDGGGDERHAPRAERRLAAAPARGDRQRERARHRDREQRGADPAAAPAERVVRDRDAEQHDRRRRRRARAEREAARGGLVEERREAAQVQPHQQRRDRGRDRRRATPAAAR